MEELREMDTAPPLSLDVRLSQWAATPRIFPIDLMFT